MKNLIYILIITNIFFQFSCNVKNHNLKSTDRKKYICDKIFSSQISKPNYIWHNDWKFNKTFKKINEIDFPTYLNYSEGIESSSGNLSQPIVIGVEDLNNDGLEDFLITHQETNRNIEVFYSNGDGTFKSNLLPAKSRLLREVSFGDFNNDGLIDIYGHTAPHNWDEKANKIYGRLKNKDYGLNEPDFLLLNKGNRFESVDNIKSITNSNNHQGALGDFNNDGLLDIFSQVSKGFFNDRFIIYGKNGNIFYKSSKKLPEIIQEFEITDAESGDMNGDGYVDLVVTEHHFGIKPDYLKDKGHLIIFYNKNGTIENSDHFRFSEFWMNDDEWKEFENYKNCLSSKHELGIHIGDSIGSDEFTLYDFDKDGDLDIVAIQKILPVFEKSEIGQRSSYIKFYENIGFKKFADITDTIFPQNYIHKVWTRESPGFHHAIHFKDVSGDGVDDLIIQNTGTKYTELNYDVFPFIYIKKDKNYLPVKIEGKMRELSHIFSIDFNGDNRTDIGGLLFNEKLMSFNKMEIYENIYKPKIVPENVSYKMFIDDLYLINSIKEKSADLMFKVSAKFDINNKNYDYYIETKILINSYDQKNPENIKIRFREKDFESLTIDEIQECTNLYDNKWLTKIKNGDLYFDIELIKKGSFVSTGYCFLEKMDVHENLFFYMLFQELEKMFKINSIKLERINKFGEYWKTHSKSQKDFWTHYIKIIQNNFKDKY